MSNHVNSDNPFDDDFIIDDENAPIKNVKEYHNVEFADFSKTKDETKTNEDIFHTYYYQKNVPYEMIFDSLKSIYKNMANKEELNKIFQCFKSGELENGNLTAENYSELNFGFYFPIWTSLCASLMHLIVTTLTFKTENIVNTSIIFALVTVSIQYSTLVYNYKKEEVENGHLRKFFIIGVSNIHYLILRLFIGLILTIFLGNFISCIIVLILQLFFVFVALKTDTTSSTSSKIKGWHLELLKWVVIVLLDFFI
ncbi:hypothetical protein QEN19_000927 [Hanseniaspora menglaensis]